MKIARRITCLLFALGSVGLGFAHHAYATDITSCEDLQAMTGSTTYVLTGNINCDEFAFTPIEMFSGVFNGNGHTISNLTSQNGGNGEALFNNTNGAVIYDLTLDDVDIIGNFIVGGLVGTAVDTKIINVHVTGALQSSAAVSMLGGIAGQTDETTIIANSSVAITATGNSVIGGVVGVNRGIIRRTSAYAGSITGSDNGDTTTNIGGLAGENAGASALIEDSFSLMTVSGSENGLGGLVGNNVDNATISRSYAAGVVTGPQARGLVGVESAGATTVNSFWHTEISGVLDSAAGTGLVNTQMTASATFTAVGYDLEHIWVLTEEGVSLPVLIFLGETSSPTVPRIATLAPENGATGLARSTSSLVLTFEEPVFVGTGYVDVYRGDTRRAHIDVSGDAVTGDGTTTITIALPSSLASGAQYVQIDDTAFDSFSGIPYAGIADTTTWRFTVRAASDPTPATPRDFSVNNVQAVVHAGAVDITWNSGTDVSYVTIWATDEQGATWQIATNRANTGSATWVYPASETPDAITITVASTDLADLIASSTSLMVELVGTTTSMPTEAAPADEAINNDQATGPSPVDGSIEVISPVVPGMYIKSPSFATVYYVTDDYQRRPFFNEAVYFTYTESMDEIVVVTDATLPTLPLAASMPPKAGVVLLKIPTNETVYEVATNGQLHRIATEEDAVLRYGAAWSDYVIDLDPVFFGQLIRHNVPLTTPSAYANRAIMKTRQALAVLAGR